MEAAIAEMRKSAPTVDRHRRSAFERLPLPGFGMILLPLLLFSPPTNALAQCAVPFQLSGNDLGDAQRLSADNQAVAGCIEDHRPSGVANSVQLGTGSPDGFANLAPLSDGQVMIGATSNRPALTVLNAGSGIVVTNSPGQISLSLDRTPSFYSEVLSDTPTLATTGLTNWLNQGSSTTLDSAVGLTLDEPSQNSDGARGLYAASPSPPYTATALIAVTRNSPTTNGTGIGWYDGSSKLHVISFITQFGGGLPYLEVEQWSSPASWHQNDFISASNGFAQPIWLQIADDGTSVSFRFSQDGSNFLTVFSTSKASGYLGAGGYSNILFFANPLGTRTLSTIMSWNVKSGAG